MAEFLNTITQIIRHWGSGGVLVAGIVEQVIVPIPSPIVPMGGGFFLVEKQIGFFSAFKEVFFKVALPFSLGSTLGSTGVFLLAFFGGAFLINRFSKYIDLEWKEVEKFKDRFFHGKPTDELLIYLFMAIPVIPSSLISAVAGAIRIRPFDFYLFTFLGLLTRGVVLGALGWWAGEAYLEVAQGVDKIESLMFIILGLAVLILLAIGYWRRDKWLKK